MATNTTSHCSPIVKRQGTSCYTRASLLRIAELYNEAHANNKLDLSVSETKLWKALHARMMTACGDDESCWIEQPFLKTAGNSQVAKHLQQLFKPKKPSTWENNPTEWLNTNDIQAVMQQYEQSDNSYRFVGVFPIDFATRTHSGQCVSQEMCQLDLVKEWKNGTRRLGIVFNTDRSSGPGIHWISLYIGLDPRRTNYGVYFYDSVASKPPPQLATYMKTLYNALKRLHAKSKSKRAPELLLNKQRRQYKGYNCGMFAMVFQIFMLRHPFAKVCKMIGYDDDVQHFRHTLYRPA